MSSHVNQKFLEALSLGLILQYTYLGKPEDDILNGAWFDLKNDEDGLINLGACAQMISGVGSDYGFRIKG